MADLTARNREHFDQHASDHMDNFGALIQAAIDEIQARRSWISNKLNDAKTQSGVNQEVRLLDYACGSGTATKALIPFVTQAVGLDLSQGMVDQYNKWAQEQGYGPDKVVGYQHDLLGEPQAASGEQSPPPEALSGFDIAVISMALHHVSDPGKMLEKLAGCLKPGGVCVVLDRVSSDHRPELEIDMPEERKKVLSTINKHGFDGEELRKLYQDAGLGRNFEHVVIEKPFEITLHNHKLYIKGFISRGEKE